MAIKKWFLIFSFFLASTQAFAVSLKEKLLNSAIGSYVVIEQNKNFTLLHLHSQEDGEYIFEEISVPSHQVKRKEMNWKKWVQQYAPGHTSWILYAVNLDLDLITECFSFSQDVHLSTDVMDSFFTTLLNLDLSLLPIEERIQRGASQKPGEIRYQHPWSPPQYVEGKLVEDPNYDVFSARWPHDHTELSGKELVLYFDHAATHFPFPYWVQLKNFVAKFKLRAVDSGKELSSPYKKIPRRFPNFHPVMKKEKEQLIFTLSSPCYYSDFHLYAIDTTVSPRVTHSIPMQITREKEKVTFFIDQKELARRFLPKHRYLFVTAPVKGNQYAEYPYLFTWEPPLPLKKESD